MFLNGLCVLFVYFIARLYASFVFPQPVDPAKYITNLGKSILVICYSSLKNLNSYAIPLQFFANSDG